MTFPTIAISQSCLDGSQTEVEEAQLVFMQDVESGYYKENRKTAVIVEGHPRQEM